MCGSLRSRLLFTYLLVSGLVLVLVVASLVFLMLRTPYTNRIVYQRLDDLVGRIAYMEWEGLSESRVDMIQTAVERLDEKLQVRILILDPGHQVLADSRPEEGAPQPGFMREKGNGNQPLQGEFRDTTNKRWLWVAAPLDHGRTIVLASLRPVLRSLLVLAKELIVPLMETALVALFASVLLAWITSRWVTAPLDNMVEASKDVAAGNYDRDISLDGPEEVRSLAIAFNNMAHRVKASQQMERDFVANVSHELKTPLTSIKGFSQAILDGAVDNVAAREHAARVIYDEANRLHRLVEDLLDLAKIDSRQIEFGRKPVNLGLLVRNVIEKLSLRAAEKGIDITDRLPELPIIIGDGDRLAQVLTNLCDNAIQHTPEGKTVCVHGETEGNWVLIHVDDSGPGIPPSELSRIFERFYQIDKARKHGKGQGSGLGLAISREIVRAHGGRLVAQSVAGYGSRFSLSLPIVQPGDETLVSSQS